jgi:transposase
VHKETVVACARSVAGGRVQREVETFATTVRGLLRLADWLGAHGCTQVAMEATGVYWRPVWHVLEGRCELVLANPTDVRNVPGRKSDVNDAVWLADLLAHGLVRSSFVPPRPIQELRDLTRTRQQLVRQVARHTLRIQKTLEDAQLKITGVVSDLLGASGRAILPPYLARVCAAAPPHGDLQALAGPIVHRQGARHRGPVPGAARQGTGALCRREGPDLGARSQPAAAAATAGAGGAANA